MPHANPTAPTFDDVTSGLAELSDVAQRPSIDGVLAAVRELLGMDVAFATEFIEDQQALRYVGGDGESFGLVAGGSIPLDQTYCQKILAGRLPAVMPDVRADERAASMPITDAAGVGAFTSVPMHLSDGRLYGTLCAANHDAKSTLGYRELQFLHVFARIVIDQLEREAITEAARRDEVESAATSALVAAVQARDTYTADHSRQVVELAGAIARHIGLDEPDVADVERVALLHDIGKISVPDAILHKPGPLSEAEWEVMRKHPARGEELISRTPKLEHLAPAIRAEHERWDGNGYPDGLAGEEIPLASRICLVSDAYHAMISDRPYRQAMSPEAARDEILRNTGTQFCPAAGTALLELLADPT